MQNSHSIISKIHFRKLSKTVSLQIKRAVLLFSLLAVLFNGFPIEKLPFGFNNPLTSPTEASAHYQFGPVSGQLVVGTEKNILASTAPVAEPVTTNPVNCGSWKCTLADDNTHWMATGAAASPSLNMQLSVGGVSLNGANKMLIQTEFDTDANIGLKIQICDWVSSTSVDSAADAQCTTGGWRTINSQDATNADINITGAASSTAFQYHLYDGYFSTGSTGGTALSTPLSNFLKATTNQVKIRYYSTAASLPFDIDYLRVSPIVDSVYFPAGATSQNAGTLTGTYSNVGALTNTATAMDSFTAGGNAQYFVGNGAAAAVADFYL